MQFCLSCLNKTKNIQIKYSYLCSQCEKFLPSLACPRFANGFSLFAYQGFVKEIVIQTKIGQSWPHQILLKELVQDAAKNILFPLLTHAQFIAPAPSSLWSRLRGRFDIASMMAEQFASVFGFPIIYPPLQSYARLRKQTAQKVRSSHLGCLPRVEARFFYDSPYFLLVDDVLTSGYTITHTATYWPQLSYRYITFAKAVGTTGDNQKNDTDDEAIL